MRSAVRPLRYLITKGRISMTFHIFCYGIFFFGFQTDLNSLPSILKKMERFYWTYKCIFWTVFIFIAY